MWILTQGKNMNFARSINAIRAFYLSSPFIWSDSTTDSLKLLLARKMPRPLPYAVKISARVSSCHIAILGAREMATATSSNSLPAESASDSRSDVSEKVYEPMQQCISPKQPVESASDSLASSVSPTDSSTQKVYEPILQVTVSTSLQSRLRQHSVYVRY